VDEKAASDLEILNEIYEVGNAQIRRTFDLYLELVDKFNELNQTNKEQDDGAERDI